MLKKWQIDAWKSVDGWDQFLSKSSEEKKKQLLEIAKSGESKPITRKHPLGLFLFSYINPKNDCYDAEFTKQIKELRPDWFVKFSEEQKKKLLKMAENKQIRPSQRTSCLGTSLCNYTNPKKVCYDAEFTKQIKKLRPDWFSKSSEKNKRKLLEMAKNKENRPIMKKHSLGNIIVNYTNPKNDCYDAEFTKQIKELRPDWFVNQSDRANDNKKELLKMAKNGESKPVIRKNPLGILFHNYTNPKNRSYDTEFTKQIKELRPDWLTKSSIENKRKLLEMAKNGEEKPCYKNPLGNKFRNYTTLNRSYDTEFTKQIKELRPDWF